MTAGLSVTGFVPATVSELIAAFETAQLAQVDPAINTSATSLLGNLTANYGSKLAELWELAQAVYDARDPQGAQGVALDAIGALRGVVRLAATRSTVVLQLTLDPNGHVDAGAVVSVTLRPDIRFVTLNDVDNPTNSQGPFEVVAVAEVTGPVVAGAGALAVIESPTGGWVSVTNLLAARMGTTAETDSAYRLRQVKELARAGSSTLAGIASDLRAVADVVSVTVLENVGDVTDADGMPPHSVEAVVLGGDDAAIANAIWSSGKPAGIATHGNTAVTITDASGGSQVVNFTRPELVPIGLRWRGTYDATYDATADNPGVWQTLNTVTTDPTSPAYFAVGRPVYLARLLEYAMGTQGVVNLTLNAEADAVPASATPSAVDAVVPITARQLPQLQAGLFEVEP